MPSDVQRVGDLEIVQDHDFQRLNWYLQRYCWAGMAVVLVLGLLGAFGHGPASHATAGVKGGPLYLEYERFARFQSDAALKAELWPGDGSTGEARLWLNREYLEGAQIERIDPVPVRVEAGPERSAYVFLLVDPDRPTRVTIHARPERSGLLKGSVSLDYRGSFDFTQFVYP